MHEHARRCVCVWWGGGGALRMSVCKKRVITHWRSLVVPATVGASWE
jgi:hypothetical protein